MEDMTLVYNVNLCRICQIPDQLNLEITSTIAKTGETYLDLLKFIFNDISWIDDSQTSWACNTCRNKIEDTAEFKTMCLESNKRRGRLKVVSIKKEETEELLEVVASIAYDPDENDANNIECIKVEKEQSKVDTTKRKLKDSKSAPKVKRKRKGRPPKKASSPMLTVEESEEFKPKTKAISKPHHCDICNIECKNLEAFDRHMNHHNGSRNYVCTVCGRAYITRDDLKQHSYRHNTEATHECQICPGKKYRTARDLRTHKKIVHSNRDDFKYLCTECGMKFPQLCTLKTHLIRRHSTIRDFKCEMCGKEFAEKSDLKDHYTTHTNVKEYKCDLCPAEYKRRDVLRNHKTKQHGIGNYKFPIEKKFDCSFCGKKITKDKLKRHIRTHTGVKPYNCRLCDMKFICNSYIKGHLKVKHDIDVESIDFSVKMYYDVNAKLLEQSNSAAVVGGTGSCDTTTDSASAGAKE